MNIEEINLTFENAIGHEHRLESLAQLVVRELHTFINRDFRFTTSTALTLDDLTMPSVEVSFNRMTDEEIARLIAEALYTELARQLPMPTSHRL